MQDHCKLFQMYLLYLYILRIKVSDFHKLTINKQVSKKFRQCQSNGIPFKLLTFEVFTVSSQHGLMGVDLSSFYT